MDTGSGAFLVKSSDCPADECNGKGLIIAESTSFEYADPPKNDKAEYADGTYLEGSVAFDRICPTIDTTRCSIDQ